ncbi:hypothetical protein BUALT_Bualt11G0068100 [Buddleja alternifolia]|uniref:Uncharacterized protein n=1 Tax=Buddleja alternifolia TaxID=168488 RepID=A0AAV6WXW1_9LAMI|nr:hypothetical protein BUALT_Bualt11G0068100 [Buddleja alternifolia]
MLREIYELLPGDIVHLGDQVPADGLFFLGFSLSIDESSLTGESDPVIVNEESPFLLSGTKVQDGLCKMVITTVGMRTQWGKLMATISEGGDDETPLQKWKDGTTLNWSGDDALELLEYFAIAVTIVVVALVRPEVRTSICSDKTGTLTTNHMTVVKACICMNRKNLGTPTETAILEFSLSLGGDFRAERQKSKQVKVEPFNSTKKRMGVVLEIPQGGLSAHTKGASEIVLAACDKVINSNGEVVQLDEASINHLNAIIGQFASEALRTLCVAYMELENGWCNCTMVTGDNINTAKAIAKECGILTDDGIAIEGPVFREKSLEELLELIPKIQMMVCSSPLDKHTLVKHLRTTFNEIVAVTGDGTIDAPALHEADIGLAMGIAGTEVAKESADVIILNDNFSTIVTVAKWGRSVYVNIQKFVQFQLTVNIVALVLLWVNMIMDMLGALALATEPPNGELMKKSPVGRTGNFISGVMWRNILGQSLYQFLVIWLLQAYGETVFGLHGRPDSGLVLNTIIFNTFVFCQDSLIELHFAS